MLILQLERAADGFSVVAEYYGRGVFNKVSSTCAVIRIVTIQLGTSVWFSFDVILKTADTPPRID